MARDWLGSRWLSIIAAIGTFTGTLALLTAQQFRVEQVVVRRDSPSAQAALMRATSLSHVVGQNVFLVNTGRVAQEVAAIPSVLRARVVTHLPDVVEIQIQERVPIAAWRAQNGTFLVDDQGYVLGEAPPSATQAEPGAQDTLIVRDTTGREMAPGDHVDQHTLLAAIELAAALPAAGAGAREVEISPQGLVFVTDRQWRVIFGDTDALNAKLANLKAIVDLARTRDLKISSVDLRPKDRPFYQLAPG